jgi:endonuclease/exonuclease/phosphatase family metal-dependent hydrolase
MRSAAEPLGLPHHIFSGVTAQEDEAALSGVGILSRWPITSSATHGLGGLRAQQVEIAGPRGTLQVFGVVMDAWWLNESQARQDAVRALLAHLQGEQDDRTPLIVCGDFNADPDSDEIRMFTGRAAAPGNGPAFYDAWEVAGRDGRGCTWSNSNPWATQLLWPDRRIDYIFAAAPRRGGAGHPVSPTLLGTTAVRNTYPSDHFAVQADLRH